MNQVQYYRLLVIVNSAVPLLILVWDAWRGGLGANPTNYALHVTGMLGLVFLLLSLAITPLKMLSGWGGWLAFRRSLGLYAFFYAVLHVAIYVTFDRALSVAGTFRELSTRTFLQFGFLALILMMPLAVTSTNAMQRKLGKRWKRLHQLAYPIAILAVVHFFMSVKSDVREPLIYAGVLGLLLGMRLGNKSAGRPATSKNGNRKQSLETS